MSGDQAPPVVGLRPSSVLRKVGITAAAGAIALIIQVAANQNTALSVTLSIVIGGVSLIVQFLLEFENRLAELERDQDRHARRVEDRLNKTFATVNEATQLFSLLEESALRADAVTQLVRNSTLIQPGSPPLIYLLAQNELARMSHFLKELGDGAEVTYDGEDRDWLLGLTNCAESTIDAVSMTTIDAGSGLEGGLWTTDLGKRYLDAQSEAAHKRGVKIRRLLVLDQSVPPDSPAMASLCRKHQQASVEVKVLTPQDVPAQSQPSVFDFVLFDRAISYELTTGTWTTTDGVPIIVNTRLILQTARVEKRVTDFEKLWRSARPMPTVPQA
jgi:hypothetical protein